MYVYLPLVTLLLIFSGVKGTLPEVILDEEVPQDHLLSKRSAATYYAPTPGLVSTSTPSYTSPSCVCNCPTCNSGAHFPSTYHQLQDCMAGCDVAVQGNCYCNNVFHPTGCTIKNCASSDGDVVVGYTCYCTENFAPSDCVSRSNYTNPLCTVDMTVVNANCQCDTESHDPDNCNIRVCNPNELTGNGYHCLCGHTCDRYPPGCAKEAVY
ncbi:unnamed protein product [Orchesella dallaii]|uniref:EGF-like domain-containing protein n=1 Tax=Orchesella dallaii TaxID=48710 RepID=A0ABP1RGS1_9HEXA